MEIKSYKKKDGTTAYSFEIYVGKENGRSKFTRKRGFKTKSDARKAIFKLQSELEKPEEKTDITFENLYKKWLSEYEKSVIDSTYYKTDKQFKNHILPDLGNKKIKDITPRMIQEFQNEWSNKLKFGRKLLGFVRSVFNYGIRLGYIDTNPAISVVAPKIKRERKEDKNFYDHDELKKFMSLAEKTGDIQKIALFRVLAFTGIRKGELLALEWSDLHDNTLEINKAISRSESGLEVSTTKNRASERLISLDRKTIEILNNLREEYPDRKLIFESENGGVLSPSKPRKWLLKIIKDSDLKQITIHGFRHTHASLIFESGMTLKQAQHRLGHSDLQTTMNIYTHITQKAIDDIGEKFSKYVDF